MGNFSKPPDQVFQASVQKGYVGLHVEQGVPVLDRDLNLLNDLISGTVRAVLSKYLGSGVDVGSDAFAVRAIPAANDFRVDAGALPDAIVGGLQLTIATPFRYRQQPGLPALTTPTAAQPDPRPDTVYLDVSLTEVDSTQDADLDNSDDVGLQTSVRLRPVWVVRVSEGVPPPGPAAGHAHYPLARLLRPRGVADIQAGMVTDLRDNLLPVTDVVRRLRLIEQLVLVPAFAPAPNQFTPKVGAPGQNVTLFARNLQVAGLVVRFGSTPATVVGVPTATQVVTQVPAMAAGQVKITVETSGGSDVSDDNFNVLAPPPPQPPAFQASPNQFTPKLGGAGVNVALFGTNFNVGTTEVRFGTVLATIVGAPTATQVVATVPAGVNGPVKVRVTTSAGSVVSDDNFTVL